MYATLCKTAWDVDIMHNYMYRFWGAYRYTVFGALSRHKRTLLYKSSIPEFWPYLIWYNYIIYIIIYIYDIIYYIWYIIYIHVIHIIIYIYIYVYIYTWLWVKIVLGSFRGAPDVCDLGLRPQQTCESAPSMGRWSSRGPSWRMAG